MLQSSDSEIKENNWHHIAFSYDESGVNLYIDGVLKSSDTDVNVDTSVASLQNMVLGSNVDGLVDNVKIYDSALSQTEIQHLAYSGNYDLALSDKVTELKFNEFETVPQVLKNESGNDATISGANPLYTYGFVEGSKALVMNQADISLKDTIPLSELSMSAWVNLDNLTSGENLIVGNTAVKFYLSDGEIKLKLNGSDIAFTDSTGGVVSLKGERFNLNFNATNDLDTSPDAATNNQGALTTTVNNGQFNNDVLSYPNASFYADKLTLSSWVKTTADGTIFDLGSLDLSVNNNKLDVSIDKPVDIQKTYTKFDTNVDSITNNSDVSGIDGINFNGMLIATNSIDFTLNTNTLTKLMPKRVSFFLPLRQYSPNRVIIYGVNDGTETEILNEVLTFRNNRYQYKYDITASEAQYDAIKVKFEGNGRLKVSSLELFGYNYSYSIAYTGQTEDVSSINDGVTDILTKDGDKLTVNLKEGVTVSAKVYNITANTTTEIENVSNGFSIGLDSGNVGDEFFVELTDSSGTAYTSNKVNVTEVVSVSYKSLVGINNSSYALYTGTSSGASYSICMWVKFNEGGKTSSPFIYTMNSTAFQNGTLANDFFKMSTDNNNIYVVTRSTSNSVTFAQNALGSDIIPTDWNFYGFKINSSQMTVYVNDRTPVVCGGGINGSAPNHNRVLFYGFQNLLEENFKRKVTDISVYNRQLSDDEFLTIYNKGAIGGAEYVTNGQMAWLRFKSDALYANSAPNATESHNIVANSITATSDDVPVPVHELSFDNYNILTINTPYIPTKITLSKDDTTIDVGTATTIQIKESGVYKAQIVTATGIVSTNSITVTNVQSYKTTPQVSSSIFGKLVLTENGELYGWGDTSHKVVPGTGKTTYPQKIDTGNLKIKRIVTGGYNAMAMDDNDNLYTWGENAYGALAISENNAKRNFTTTPLDKSLFNNEKILNIFGGDRTYGVLTQSSKLQYPTYNDSTYGNVGSYVPSAPAGLPYIIPGVGPWLNFRYYKYDPSYSSATSIAYGLYEGANKKGSYSALLLTFNLTTKSWTSGWSAAAVTDTDGQLKVTLTNSDSGSVDVVAQIASPTVDLTLQTYETIPFKNLHKNDYITYAFFIKITSNNTWRFIVTTENYFKNSTSNGNNNYSLQITNQKKLSLRTQDGVIDLQHSTALSDDTWYHVAVTIPVNSVKDVTDNIIYVNGVKVAETKSTSTYTNIAEDVLLGKQPSWSTTNTGIDGYIHDFRIYNSQLSADDISNLYNGTSTSTTPTVYIDFNDDDNSIHQYHPNSKLYTWGWNTHTQLGYSTINIGSHGCYIPTEVPKPSNGYWVYFASGHRHNQFISSKGDLYTAGYDGGYNMLGRNASGAWSNGIAKITESHHGKVVKSADGAYGGVLLNEKGELWTYGNNYTGEAGHSSQFGNNYGHGITKVTSTFDSEIIDITKSHSSTTVLTKNGGHYMFGDQTYSSLGNPLITANTRWQATLCDIPNVIASNGDGYGGDPIIITDDGHVYTFGYNHTSWASGVYGGLGTGNTTDGIVKAPMKVVLENSNGYLMALNPVINHSKNTIEITGDNMKKILYKDGVALSNNVDTHQISQTGEYSAGIQNGNQFYMTDTTSVNEITEHSMNGYEHSSSIEGLVTKVNFSTTLTSTGSLGNNARKVIGLDDNGNDVEAIGTSYGRSDFELKDGYFNGPYRRACVRVTESSGPTRHLALMSNASTKNSISSIIASSGSYTASYVLTGLGYYGYMNANFGGGFEYVSNGDLLGSSYGDYYRRPDVYGTKTMYIRVSMSSDSKDATNINKASLLIMDIKTKETHIRDFTNLTNKDKSWDRLFYFNMSGGFAQYNGGDGPDYGYDISNIVIRDIYMNQPEIPSDDLIVGFSNTFWNNMLSSDNLRLIPPIGYKSGSYQITEGSPSRTGSRTSKGGATYKLFASNVYVGNDTAYTNENQVLYVDNSSYGNGQYYFKCNYSSSWSPVANAFNDIYTGFYVTNNNNQVDIYLAINDIKTITSYSLLYTPNNPSTYTKTVPKANNTQAAKSWDLYGSIDNVNWILLHSGSESHTNTDTSYFNYSISKFNACKFFKFSFKTFKSSTAFNIYGIQLFEGLPSISFDNVNKITTSLLPGGNSNILIHNGVETNIGSATGVIIKEPGTYQIRGTDGNYSYTTEEIVVPEVSTANATDTTSYLSDLTMGYDGTWVVTNTSSVNYTNPLTYSNNHNVITTTLPNGIVGSAFHLNTYTYGSAGFDVTNQQINITAECTIKLPEYNTEFGSDYYSTNIGTQYSTGIYVLIEIGGNGDKSYAVTFNSNGSLSVYDVRGSNYANVVSTPVASSNVKLLTTDWNHVVFTMSNTTGKVYLNGTEIMSFTNNKASTMGGTIMNFRDAAGGGHGNLYIYNFRTYMRTLSQTEVTQRYNYLTRPPNLLDPVVDTSLHPKVKATADGSSATNYRTTTTTEYSKEQAQQIFYKSAIDNVILSVFNGYNGALGQGWKIFSGDVTKYAYYHIFATFYFQVDNRSSKYLKSVNLWYSSNSISTIKWIKYQKHYGDTWHTIRTNEDFAQYSSIYDGSIRYAEIPINLVVYNFQMQLNGHTNYYWHPREVEFEVLETYLEYPQFTSKPVTLEAPTDNKLELKNVNKSSNIELIELYKDGVKISSSTTYIDSFTIYQLGEYYCVTIIDGVYNKTNTVYISNNSTTLISQPRFLYKPTQGSSTFNNFTTNPSTSSIRLYPVDKNRSDRNNSLSVRAPGPDQNYWNWRTLYEVYQPTSVTDGNKMFGSNTWKVAYDFSLSSWTAANGSPKDGMMLYLGSFTIVPNGTGISSYNSNMYYISMDIRLTRLTSTTYELGLWYLRRYNGTNAESGYPIFTSKKYSIDERVKFEFGFLSERRLYMFDNGNLQIKDLTYIAAEESNVGYIDNYHTNHIYNHNSKPRTHFLGPVDTRSIVGNNRTSEGRNGFKAGANMKVYSISIQ